MKKMEKVLTWLLDARKISEGGSFRQGPEGCLGVQKVFLEDITFWLALLRIKFTKKERKYLFRELGSP